MAQSSAICSPRPREIPPTLVLLAVLGCGTAVGCAGSSPQATELVDGEAVYERYCAVSWAGGQRPGSRFLSALSEAAQLCRRQVQAPIYSNGEIADRR